MNVIGTRRGMATGSGERAGARQYSMAGACATYCLGMGLLVGCASADSISDSQSELDSEPDSMAPQAVATTEDNSTPQGSTEAAEGASANDDVESPGVPANDDEETPGAPLPSSSEEAGPVSDAIGSTSIIAGPWTVWGAGEGSTASSPVITMGMVFFCSERKLGWLPVTRGEDPDTDVSITWVAGIDSCDSVAAQGNNTLVVAQLEPIPSLWRVSLSDGVDSPAVNELLLNSEFSLSDEMSVRPTSGSQLVVNNADAGLLLIDEAETLALRPVSWAAKSARALSDTRWVVGAEFGRVSLLFFECAAGECTQDGDAAVFHDGALDIATSWRGFFYVALASGGVAMIDSATGDVVQSFQLPDGLRATGVEIEEGRCFVDLYVTASDGRLFRWSDDF